MYWGFEEVRGIYFIGLEDGQVTLVPYSEKVCVDDGRVVEAERCPADGAELDLPELEASPGYERELPTCSPPAHGRLARREPQEGDLVEGADGSFYLLKH